MMSCIISRCAIVAPMLTAREMLFVALGIFAAGYVWIWFTGKGRAPGVPSLLELLIGFVTNFFDTLGIGSFAPTAAIFKFRKMVPDEQIPGTLNVGHAAHHSPGISFHCNR